MTLPGRTVGLVGGTGPFGRGFALRAAAAGWSVVIGSRDPARGAAAAAALERPAVRGAANAEAVRAADLVVVAVPWEAHAAVLREVAPLLDGRLVLDVTVPFAPEAPGGLAPPAARAFAEETQAAAPTARVVAGFHTVAASTLGRPERPLDQDVLLCGDDAGARAAVAGLVEAFGGRPVDCGPLAAARALEGFGALVTALAVRRRRAVGVRLTNLAPRSAPPAAPPTS